MDREIRWDKIFTKKGDKYRRDFAILYWYLLKKPDYTYNIAGELEKIGGIDVPASLTDSSNLTPVIKEMCKKGLIEQYETIEVKNKERKYYRVLPEILMFPYHLELSEEELEQIKESVEGDKDIYERIKMSKKSDDKLTISEDYIFRIYNSFGKRGLFLNYISTVENRSRRLFDHETHTYNLEDFIPLLKAIPYFSVSIDKWMKNMDTKEKQNYISLLDLVLSAFEELDMFLTKFLLERPLDAKANRSFHKACQNILDSQTRRFIYEQIALIEENKIENVKVYCTDCFLPEGYEFKFIKKLDENKICEFFKKELFDRDITKFDMTLMEQLLALIIDYKRLNEMIF